MALSIESKRLIGRLATVKMLEDDALAVSLLMYGRPKEADELSSFFSEESPLFRRGYGKSIIFNWSKSLVPANGLNYIIYCLRESTT